MKTHSRLGVWQRLVHAGRCSRPLSSSGPRWVSRSKGGKLSFFQGWGFIYSLLFSHSFLFTAYMRLSVRTCERCLAVRTTSLLSPLTIISDLPPYGWKDDTTRSLL